MLCHSNQKWIQLSRKIIPWFGFLAGEGVPVTEIHQGKANLEETYLQLMEEDR